MNNRFSFNSRKASIVFLEKDGMVFLIRIYLFASMDFGNGLTIEVSMSSA